MKSFKRSNFYFLDSGRQVKTDDSYTQASPKMGITTLESFRSEISRKRKENKRYQKALSIPPVFTNKKQRPTGEVFMSLAELFWADGHTHTDTRIVLISAYAFAGLSNVTYCRKTRDMNIAVRVRQSCAKLL
jgi:hypothetical protein